MVLGYHKTERPGPVQCMRGGEPSRPRVLGLRGGDDTPVSRSHRRPGPRSTSPDAARPSRAAPTTCEAGGQSGAVTEGEWPYDDELSFKMIPAPGGCIVAGAPRGRR
jgi:hypothetical protein